MNIFKQVKQFLTDLMNKRPVKNLPGILAACSGGPDSVALIHILRRLSEELKFRLVIGHVNHRLRGTASEGDEEFVKTLGKNLGLTVYVTRVPRKYANTRHTSEETSRNFRYAALTHMARKAGCAFVATAHTQDDQAETVLMNMIRGAGTLGLCGMPPAIPLESANLALIRPFLEVSRPEILNYLKSNHLSYRTDKTNFSLKYTRNWIRHKLLPLLERKNPQIKLRLAQTATILQAEERFWYSYIENILRGWQGITGAIWKPRFAPNARRDEGAYLTKYVTEEQQRSRRKDGLPRRGWPILAWLVAYPRLRTIQVRRTAVRLEPSQNRLSQIAPVISCQPLKGGKQHPVPLKLDLRRFLKYPIYVKRRVVRHIAGSSLTFSEVERVIWLAQFASNGKKLTLRGGIIVTRYPKYLEITHSIINNINRHEK